ncbi:hypothetical protein SUDANB15_00549 [Streptomyces sp. enrichment culture]
MGGSRGHREAESGVRSMALFLAAHRYDGRAVIEIKGGPDGAVARGLCDFVPSVTAQHRHPIRDPSEPARADADGLDALMSVRTLLDRGRPRLVRPRGRMGRPLRSSGAASAPPVCPSPDAALSAPRTVPVHRTGGAMQ